MRVSGTLSSLLGGCLLLIAAGDAQSTDLLNYELRSLDEVGTRSLETLRGTPTVMMFFEPACSWCLKQTRVLNELRRQCDGLNVVAIGVNGDRRSLLDTASRMRAQFPVFQISARMQSDIGRIEGTPLLMFADSTGNYGRHFRGYQQLDRLTSAIETTLGKSCQ